MSSTRNTTTEVTLGKRKRQEIFVLQLSASTSSTPKFPDVSNLHKKLEDSLIISNGKLVHDTGRRFTCTFAGCNRSYKKPCKLEEHERSHNGERPFACTSCGKTYLRDSHLQAHSRTHLSPSEKPFSCTRIDCEKRFWTSQHLKRHIQMHDGLKPYMCTEDSCTEAFAKHNQLRAHIAASHSPPGTKPFRCEKDGCTKSFSTSQKLRAHVKTHDEHRYTCFHEHCASSGPHFFSTWSALQVHTRTAHPPVCPYPSCEGRTFSAQKGLRAHMKLHKQQELEESLLLEEEDELAKLGPPRKRRRGGELGRDWICEESGCGKDFKSKKALDVHVKVYHLRKRDFVCSFENCDKSFGYKHLLQRHTTRHHAPNHCEETAEVCEPRQANETVKSNVIDIITGKAYKSRIMDTTGAKQFICPYPSISFIGLGSTQIPAGNSTGTSDIPKCYYTFSRAYDLRRHLLSEHGLAVEKGPVDRLVALIRAGNGRGEE